MRRALVSREMSLKVVDGEKIRLLCNIGVNYELIF